MRMIDIMNIHKSLNRCMWMAEEEQNKTNSTEFKEKMKIEEKQLKETLEKFENLNFKLIEN